MRKVLIILFILTSSAVAYADEIPCTGEFCHGWYVSYHYQDTSMIVKYENETGKTAYQITCRINYFDAGGAHAGSVTYKYDGPIRKQIVFQAKYPRHFSRMEAEIYYKTEQ